MQAPLWTTDEIEHELTYWWQQQQEAINMPLGQERDERLALVGERLFYWGKASIRLRQRDTL